MKRVMSGIRSTGRPHMGNYFGAIRNYVELQKSHDEVFIGIMNWHSLTAAYKEPEIFLKYNKDLLIDMISVGVNPDKTVLYAQSDVPETIELYMIFSMLTPIPWLERVTTFKDSKEEMKQTDSYNLGRMGYPVLQTADIAVMRGGAVPVGADQSAHLEISREIIRRFNHLYGGKLPEPQTILTDTPLLPGLDGRKMSKSYGNTIPMIEEPEQVTKLAKTMVTDPARVRKTDPGNPEICPVFGYHKLFSPDEEQKEIDKGCRSAGIGCMDCKMKLAANINGFMKEPLEKRKSFLNNPKQVDEIIQQGREKAKKEAQKTMEEVHGNLSWR